ncbi:MAG: hypothetical protein CSA65_02125 [Proteobacteria bacterium]|nr:MAG: hypothetical protein CSA65_02125 [Pseudomonadota bacterium]
MGVERIEVSGVRKSKDDKGRDVLAAGKSMPSAPTAKTATLRAKADTWLGKQVRLRGRVSAQCTKRRRWFAIVDDDSGRTMRVLTVPVFLPPRQVVGKQVEVVGKLERLELPLKRAQHMAEHHKLTPPDKASIKGKRVQELVLRAVSARFFQ